MTDDTVVPFTIISTPTGDINADSTVVPDNRTFRDAWRVDGEAIIIDMPTAKEITRDKIRAERTPYLLALDVQYMKGTEAGTDVSAIVAQKQVLRDAPADPRIDEATTPEELEAVLTSVVAEMGAV